MTDDNTLDNGRKISVSFTRKISDGNYGIIEAAAWVQGDAPTDATTGAVSLLLGDLFLAAKAAVLDQLGIEYEMDAEQGVLIEKQSANVIATATAAAHAITNTHSSSSVSVRVMNPSDQDGPLPDWLLNDCGRLGITGVWDNRKKAIGTKQPWFKEAVAKGAAGNGKDGEPKAWWPPR